MELVHHVVSLTSWLPCEFPKVASEFTIIVSDFLLGILTSTLVVSLVHHHHHLTYLHTKTGIEFARHPHHRPAL
jgi:hypothetical protein